MKKFSQITPIFCGLLVMLAAFPVFAQERVSSENTVDKKPLRDWANFLFDKLEKSEVDLTQPFLVELDGELTEEGKFDKQKPRFVRAEGDKQMIEIAKRAIEAFNDSGMFSYLRVLEIKKFNLVYAQDDKQIYAVIKSEQVSSQRARTISSGFNGMINMAKIVIKSENEKNLLNSAKITSKDKLCILEFALAKSAAHEIIKQEFDKEIVRRKAKEQNSQ